MNDDLIAGIDLGTTYSLVGVVDSGFPIILADGDGNRLTPSVVHYPEKGAPQAGATARRVQVTAPERTIASVKRLMGRRASEIEDFWMAPIESGEGTWAAVRIGEDLFSPEAISAEILKHLRSVAEAALEQTVTRAVITVPAYFNDGQRNATKRAGELAGWTVERILNEPTAAALAYGLDKLGENSRVAVYDFGGGTFDLSILELREGVFQVIATHGDTRLGGDDIDRALADHLKRILGLPEALDAIQESRLLQAARAAKEAVSDGEDTEVRLPFFAGKRSYGAVLTRPEFEAIARPIIARTRPLCLRALADAGLLETGHLTGSGPGHDPVAPGLDRVILVGGSTRIPLVRATVAELFGQAPDTSQNPDEAVALGAAIQAGILCGRVRNVVLLDVTPLSLGLETFGGLMSVILPRNTTIPARAGELFTNALANQESMLVRVLQGEREMACDNWELGRITLEFQPGPKGHARVGVQFSIDENGILTVLARDTRTGADRILEITGAAVDVEDEKVEAMVSESVDHAFEDMHRRIWTEARMKSEELLPAVDQALAAAGDALEVSEIETIRTAAAEVKAALEAELPDAHRLQQANRTLDQATETLAAILVERALEKALRRED